jgi:hypothetical protein
VRPASSISRRALEDWYGEDVARCSHTRTLLQPHNPQSLPHHTTLIFSSHHTTSYNSIISSKQLQCRTLLNSAFYNYRILHWDKSHCFSLFGSSRSVITQPLFSPRFRTHTTSSSSPQPHQFSTLEQASKS